MKNGSTCLGDTGRIRSEISRQSSEYKKAAFHITAEAGKNERGKLRFNQTF